MDSGKHFVKGKTSVPLKTHAFIPALCSIHYCTSFLKRAFHGQRFTGCILTDRDSGRKYTWILAMYVCTFCTFVHEQLDALDLSVFIPRAFTHTLKSLRNLKDMGKMFGHISKTWLPSKT